MFIQTSGSSPPVEIMCEPRLINTLTTSQQGESQEYDQSSIVDAISWSILSLSVLSLKISSPFY